MEHLATLPQDREVGRVGRGEGVKVGRVVCPHWRSPDQHSHESVE